MALLKLLPKDIVSILKAVRQIVHFPVKQMWIDFDEDADVLYISFQRPQRAADSELRDDGIIVHRRRKQIVGLTILEASKR